MDFLSRWNANGRSSILKDISPDFTEHYIDLRTEGLYVETFINNVVPTVGRSQNLVFDNNDHSDMFTEQLHDVIDSNFDHQESAN